MEEVIYSITHSSIKHLEVEVDLASLVVALFHLFHGTFSVNVSSPVDWFLCRCECHCRECLSLLTYVAPSPCIQGGCDVACLPRPSLKLKREKSSTYNVICNSHQQLRPMWISDISSSAVCNSLFVMAYRFESCCNNSSYMSRFGNSLRPWLWLHFPQLPYTFNFYSTLQRNLLLYQTSYPGPSLILPHT